MFSAAREGDLPSPLALLHYELNTPIPAQVYSLCLLLGKITSSTLHYELNTPIPAKVYSLCLLLDKITSSTLHY